MSCNSLLDSSNADLVGYYSFNETSGTTVADNSGAGNDATASADMSTLTGTGEFGNCITLAGTNYAAATKSGGFASYPFSIRARFKHDGTAASRCVMAVSDADSGNIYWQMQLSSSHTMFAVRRNITVYATNTGATLTSGIWYDGLMVFADATSAAFYLDGSEEYNSSSLDSVSPTANAVDMLIGDFRTTDVSTQWIGDLDEVAFWTAELSATDAAQLAAGPEPIWLGTGTHHFGIARGVAYWNCPSTAWGLPTYLNAASTDNGSLTAEVRIVRDRGKATEATVATSTGFSGSVACAGSTDNLTLELRVSNDGGYDDSLGDDADGWVSVAWYGLEAKLVGQWNLDEQDGTVARNQVRTMVLSEDFGSVGSTDSYGYLPAGWSRWAVGVTAGANASVAKTDEGFRVYLKYDGAGGDYLGASVSAPVSGTRYVLNAQVKVNAIVGATSELRCAIASGVWVTVVDSSTATGDWIDVVVDLGEANLTVMYLSAYSASGGGSVDVEVRNVTLYAENAGAYDRDASLTHETVSGLGAVTDAQDFNGTSDLVTLGSAVSFTGAYTVAFWAKRVYDSTFDFALGHSSENTKLGFRNNVQDDVFIRLQPSGASENVASGVDTTEWHHYAIGRDASGAGFLYVDGVAKTVTLTGQTGTANFDQIGKDELSANWHQGGIARVYLFSRVLEDWERAEIQAEGPLSQLDVARVGHFKLEEAAGDVCRNEVRTLRVANPTLTGTGGTSEYGTSPDGWQEIGAGPGEGAATITSEATGSSWIGSVLNGGGGSAQTSLRQDGITTIGEIHVLVVEWRLLSEVVGTPTLRAWTGGSTVEIANLADFTVADGWQTTTTLMLAATNDEVNVSLVADSLNEYAHVEIRSAYVYAENAGTPSENMSGLTAPGVSGRGVLMDGSQHILAPYAAGFGSYPFSMGCAFKHDGTAAFRYLMSIADADAGNVYWSLQLTNTGVMYVLRRNTTQIADTTGQSPDTNWHTALAVFPDATSAIVYLDGAEVLNSTSLTSVAATSAAVDMLIGDFRTTDVGSQMIGNLDEASFWTRALSAAEAAEWHQFTIFPLAARHSAEPLGLETSLSL